MRSLSLVVGLGLLLGCSDADDGDAKGMAGAGSSKPAASGGNKTGGTNQGGSTGAKGGSASTAGGSPTTGGADDDYGDARIRCVDRTNELRASIGLDPIPRLASAEPCVDGQAKSDSETGKAHGAFDACLDEVDKWKGAGQNECPGYGSVESALGACLDMMWAEGPGGGHYDNMVGSSTHTACGFYTTPKGKVWMIQDFWTE